MSAPNVIRVYPRRKPPMSRNFDRTSESVAANTFELLCTVAMDEAVTLMGVRVSAGFTLASAGVSKAEMWLVVQPEDTSVPDPTTNEDAVNSKNWLAFWEVHLSQETPVNINENINVRRRLSRDDNISLYAKSASGFDVEAMMLAWTAGGS